MYWYAGVIEIRYVNGHSYFLSQAWSLLMNDKYIENHYRVYIMKNELIDNKLHDL